MNNVVAAFFAKAKEQQAQPCFHYKHKGIWKMLTWAEVDDLVRQYARGLIALGVNPGTPVAILSATRMEWTLMDFAILAAGGISVPIYSNLPADQIGFIVRDSGAVIVAIENDDMLPHVRQASTVKTIIQFDDGAGHEKVLSLHALIERGNACLPKTVDERTAALASDTPVSYVYTSGTTGAQKGVVLTHGNLAGEIGAAHRSFNYTPDEVCLVCLPQAHVLGRMAEFYLMTKGCQSAFAESIEKLAENYREVRPHFVVGVPRMLEKALERIQAAVADQPPVKRKLFAWAKDVAVLVAQARQRRLPIGAWLALQHALANKLVYRKLLDRMGGRLRSFVCGGAPLNKEVGKFFTGIGVSVCEGYGLTETFAAVTVNRPDDFHFGTVGKPFEGVQIKIASDGEILVRGPMVFKGYLNRPDATAEAFEGEWFKTGDIGEFSKEGFLRITDRKKDIIVTAGGKNIAPQRIEGIMTESPYINHVMVCGDSRKYLSALVALNYDEIRKFAQDEGIMYGDRRELADHPRIHELIDRVIAEKNQRLARYETIKRFAIVPDEFSVETGEITPTLKIKRRHVIQKYNDMIERMYAR